MDTGCPTGGIIAVLQILEDYKPAFTYDFRARFGLGLDSLGTTVPWSEVISLVAVLLRDPTSWLQTAKNDWQHPISYDWTIAAATYDLLAQVNSKRKPKPWPRPWKDSGTVHKGKKIRRDARAILTKAKDGDLDWQNKLTPM
jgi:hypothetical protein